MGSRTFHDMSAHWPWSTEPYAPPMNEIPKIVFSRGGLGTPPGQHPTTRALADAQAHRGTATRVTGPALESWRAARVAAGGLAEEIARLKQEPGKEILAHGGATFAQSLVNLGVVDEYRLLVHPVALGRGLPLFSTLSAPIDLELVEAKAFGGGAVAHIYRPRAA
jgi:dihydrofolate reductase